ncbi:dockerin type I domain-containing protein [Paenibacillus sp. GYB004]|uniref:carbohydrate binding domain-containing protein n=1 Tax=Paenibacillus sp. GYB004 TaxID=2994393 RepID=UPI002F962EA3
MSTLRKRISVLAVMALLAAVFAGLPLPGIVAADPSQPGIVAMVNPGFEDEIGQDGKIPGWNANYTVKDDVYGKVTHSVYGTVSKSGGKSLNLFDNSNKHTVELVSDKYPVIPGNEYTLSAWINPNEPQGRKDGSIGGTIQLRFYDANNNELTGNRVANNYNSPSGIGKFTQILVKSNVVPAEAKYVSVAVLITAYWTGNTYFDDFELKYTTTTPTLPPEDLSEKVISSNGLKEVVSIPVPNAGFERGMTGSGAVDGWRNWAAPSETVKFELSSAVKYSGSASLKLTDTQNNNGVTMESQPLPVKPGVEYTASVRMYVESTPAPTGGATFLLRFFDDKDKQTGPDTLQHLKSPLNEWFKVELKGVAPASAKHAKLFALVNNAYMAVAYYDDMLFTYERDLMQLDITSAEYAVKDRTFTARLGSKYAESLTAAELNVAFDATKLQVVEAAVHPDFGTSGNTTLTWEVDGDLLTVRASRTDNGVVNGHIGLVTVTFKALSGQGNTVLSLKANSVLKSLKGGTVEDKTFPGDVKARTTLLPHLEDVNHDGVVNLVDLLLAAKSVNAGLDGMTKYYDLNGDGKIDTADIDILAKALAAN